MGNGGGFGFQAAFGRIILASLELSAFRLPNCCCWDSLKVCKAVFGFVAALGFLHLASLKLVLFVFRLPDCYYLNAAVGQPENLMRCGGKLSRYVSCAHAKLRFRLPLGCAMRARAAMLGLHGVGVAARRHEMAETIASAGLGGMLVYWQTCFQAAFGGAS